MPARPGGLLVRGRGPAPLPGHHPGGQRAGAGTGPQTAPKYRHLRPGGVRHHLPFLDRHVPGGGAALPAGRGHPPLHRRGVRDRLRLHHHRGQHPHRCGGHGPGTAVLAQLHPLGGGDGGAGVPAGHPPPGRGAQRPHHAGGESRPGGGQAGAPGPGHRQDTLWYLHHHDPHPHRPAAVGGDASL